MSLQLAAQHLQQHGRNGDSMLVHMSPNEVQSLNTLAKAHGGQLTTNPHTGLPEAGFLSSILPSIVGFGLNAAFPGLGAMGSGLITGGLSMALNPKGGLMGGLMAGMGAYGGAGLGDALAKTGMEEATQAELAKNQAFQQAQQAATPQALAAANPTQYGNLTDVATKGLPTGMTPDAYTKIIQESSAPAAQMAQATADRVAVDSGFGAPGLTTSTAGNRMGTALEGIKTLGAESGRGAFVNNIGGGMGLAKYGLAAATPAINESIKQSNEVPTTATDKDLGRRYTFNAGQTEPTPQADSLGREKRYFTPSYNVIGDDQAKGVYGFADGGPIQNLNDLEYQNTGVARMATGGLPQYNLGGYSDGGRLLRGPGDGVSDSIPATIGEKQPARLADGEFVVPARIVSELGNGSTEAGARKLYAMMDRVQKARGQTVGQGNVAKNSKAEKYLPA